MADDTILMQISCNGSLTKKGIRDKNVKSENKSFRIMYNKKCGNILLYVSD